MKFYLGVPEPAWLNRDDLKGIPVFISHTRLRRVKNRLHHGKMPVAIDSGGFTEIDRHGRWQTTITEYLDAMYRYVEEIGTVEWMSPMDWMVEPWMVAKTGLTTQIHQELTTWNYCELKSIAPELPIIPVVQGWEREDYVRHREMYASAGVDLAAQPLVGVGSVCRRQHTDEAVDIFTDFAEAGINVHGFGVKVQGFARYRSVLASSDSMAWSLRARKRGRPISEDCTHANCNYCPRFALEWRRCVLEGRPTP